MILSLLLPQHNHPQGIHHPGNIDPFGASRGTLEAGSAEPEGIDSKRLFLQTQKGITNDLVGTNFHGKGNRTPGRTIPALITGKEILSADKFDLFRELVMNPLARQLNLHLLTPLLRTFSTVCVNANMKTSKLQ
jgi:hypothetical protein